MVGKDTLWKAIIEDLIEEFLHFFFPENVDQIDFERGFTYLAQSSCAIQGTFLGL